MLILTHNPSFYRVVRPISGSGYAVGDIVPAGEIKTARSLAQLGRLVPSDGPARRAAATTATPAPSPAAIPASTAAVTVEAEPEGNKRHQRRR